MKNWEWSIYQGDGFTHQTWSPQWDTSQSYKKLEHPSPKWFSVIPCDWHEQSAMFYSFSTSHTAWSNMTFMEMTGWWFQPLWKIWKSIGMMTFPIYGKIKVMFQTTNQMTWPSLLDATWGIAVRANLQSPEVSKNLHGFQCFSWPSWGSRPLGLEKYLYCVMRIASLKTTTIHQINPCLILQRKLKTPVLWKKNPFWANSKTSHSPKNTSAMIQFFFQGWFPINKPWFPDVFLPDKASEKLQVPRHGFIGRVPILRSRGFLTRTRVFVPWLISISAVGMFFSGVSIYKDHKNQMCLEKQIDQDPMFLYVSIKIITMFQMCLEKRLEKSWFFCGRNPNHQLIDGEHPRISFGGQASLWWHRISAIHSIKDLSNLP